MPRTEWSMEPGSIHAEPGKVVRVKDNGDVVEWTPEFARGYANLLVQMAACADYLAEHPERYTMRRPER